MLKLSNNSERWSSVISEMESRQLKRELTHLLQKSRERGLSEWELSQLTVLKSALGTGEPGAVSRNLSIGMPAGGFSIYRIEWF